MARINLTAGRIRDFSTDKGQAFLWDSDTPGLAVRAAFARTLHWRSHPFPWWTTLTGAKTPE